MLIMIGRWRNVHTDIDHDSIPSPVSVYTRGCVYAYIYIYVRRGERCMSRILLNPGSSRTSPFPPLPPPSPNIPRNTPLYRAASKSKEREIFTRELPCTASPYLESTYLPFPSRSPSAMNERGREDPFDLFSGTFISATGHRLNLQIFADGN